MDKKEKEITTGATPEFKVLEPESVRPKELPLLITPTNGSWVNKEQEEYARTLNAYAYKNPEKWKQNQVDPISGQEIPNSSKRDVCLKQLSELGRNPNLIGKLRGNNTNLAYNDKAYGANVLP